MLFRSNQDYVGNKYSRIARAMGQNESIDLANEIEKLNEKIGIPRNLKEMGITEDLIPNLVAHAKEDPSNLTTPRLPTQNEWEELFLEALE